MIVCSGLCSASPMAASRIGLYSIDPLDLDAAGRGDDQPSAWRRRSGPRARAAANPPNTTRVDGAEARAGEHRDDGLGDHRQVDDDPVALPHAKPGQRARELGGLVSELGERERLGDAGHRGVVDQGGLVAAPAADVAIEGVVAGVKGAADEPAVEGRVSAVKDRLRLLVPVDRPRGLPPEPGRVLQAAAENVFVSPHERRVGRPRLASIPASGRAQSAHPAEDFAVRDEEPAVLVGGPGAPAVGDPR